MLTLFVFSSDSKTTRHMYINYIFSYIKKSSIIVYECAYFVCTSLVSEERI